MVEAVEGNEEAEEEEEEEEKVETVVLVAVERAEAEDESKLLELDMEVIEPSAAVEDVGELSAAVVEDE